MRTTEWSVREIAYEVSSVVDGGSSGVAGTAERGKSSAFPRQRDPERKCEAGVPVRLERKIIVSAVLYLVVVTMWELVKRSLQRERAMTAVQLGRPRRASVQRMHNEIVEAFLKAGRQRVRRAASGRLGSVDSMAGDGVGERGARGGIWKAVSSLGFAIAMAIRLLNPYVLISVAFGQRRSLLAHLSARVDSMRAVLSPRIGRRRRLTAWVQDMLPQRHVPEAASAVWQDGSLLCGIVEAVVPGSCPGYDSLSPPNADRGATLWLGQKLAARYLGVPPAFSDDEFSQTCLTIYMERRMLRYLSALKTASARVDAERHRRLAAIQGNAGSTGEEDAFSLDTVAHSSLQPGESLLECVARGMGLILGVQGRRSTFYLYLNPHHPHRHVHRLMQRSNTLERHTSFEEEAGAILMQIRGPEGDFGAALLSTSPGSSSSSMGPSLAILKQHWYGRIPISYDTAEEMVTVSFVPQSSGRHELILLQRGGSHVPGSPFSITVEESSEVPDDDGKRRRFGSEPVDGLVVPTQTGIVKTTSYESGLNISHRRIGSGGSDPGTRSEGESPEDMKPKRRVVARVVDFVTEKMLLTEDGKLERLPKKRRRGLEKMKLEDRDLLTEEYDIREKRKIKRSSNLHPTWGRMEHLDADEVMHETFSDERSSMGNGKSSTSNSASVSGLKMGTNALEDNGKEPAGKCRGTGEKKTNQVSDFVSNSENETLDSIHFREHCRRILWLCDILLKHSPRQESLEMLNTAGDILEGKRVHPTILEENEPEEAAATSSYSITNEQTSAKASPLEQPARAAQPTSYAFAQKLHRTPRDMEGLNEMSSWKGGRRQFHSWTQKNREGSGTVGTRVIQKRDSYQGVLVRDMTPEALSGAYVGGDDLMDNEELQPQGGELVDWGSFEERYLLESVRPEPRMPHHSLPKRRHPSLSQGMENRRHSSGTLKQRTSTSDREKDGGRTTVSGKEINKSIASNNKRQINYSDKNMVWAFGGWGEKDRDKIIKAGVSRSHAVLKANPRRQYSDKEDKRPIGMERKNIICAAAVAFAEGGDDSKREEESREETLSNIGTRTIPGGKVDAAENEKAFLVASSKGEPPPVKEIERDALGGLGGKGGKPAECAGEMRKKDEEAGQETRRKSGTPASAQAEAPGAMEINESLPPPRPGQIPHLIPSAPDKGPSAEQSPEPPEGTLSKSSDVVGSSTSSGSGYPCKISENTSEGEHREAITKGRGREDRKEAEEIEDEIEDGELEKEAIFRIHEEKKKVNENDTNPREKEIVKKNETRKIHEEEKFEEDEKGERLGPKEDEIALVERRENVEPMLVEKNEEKECFSGEMDKEEVAGVGEETSITIKKSNIEVDNWESGEDTSFIAGEETKTSGDALESYGECKDSTGKWSLSKETEVECEIIDKDEKETLNIFKHNQQERLEVVGKKEELNSVKRGDKGLQLQNAENYNNGDEDKGSEKDIIETTGKNTEISKLVNFADIKNHNETEGTKEEVFVNINREVVVISENVNTQNFPTVIGNEEQNFESNQIKNISNVECRAEKPYEPQKNPIVREEKSCKAIVKDILDEKRVIEGGKVEEIAAAVGNIERDVGDIKIGQEKFDECSSSKEFEVIAKECGAIGEAEGKGNQGNVGKPGSKGITVDQKITYIVEESNKEETKVLDKERGNNDIIKSLNGEGVTAQVREQGVIVKFEGHVKVKGEVIVGDEKKITDSIALVNSEGNVGEDRCKKILRCETCGRSTIGEGVQNTGKSENAGVLSQKDQNIWTEEKPIKSMFKDKLNKEDNTDIGMAIPINEKQEDEIGKRKEETLSKEEISKKNENKEEVTEKEVGMTVETFFDWKEQLDIEDMIIKMSEENTIRREKERQNNEKIIELPPTQGMSPILEEIKKSDACYKTESSSIIDTKRKIIVIENLTRIEVNGSEAERLNKEVETTSPNGNVAMMEMKVDSVDQGCSLNVASKENRKVIDNDDPAKVAATIEMIKDLEGEDEIKEAAAILKSGGENDVKENETMVIEECSEISKDSSVENTKMLDQMEIMIKDTATIEGCTPMIEKEIKVIEPLKLENMRAGKREFEEKGKTEQCKLDSWREAKDEIGNDFIQDIVIGENKSKKLDQGQPTEMTKRKVKDNKSDEIMFIQDTQYELKNEEIKEFKTTKTLPEDIYEHHISRFAPNKDDIIGNTETIELITPAESPPVKNENTKPSATRVESIQGDICPGDFIKGKSQESDLIKDSAEKELDVLSVKTEEILFGGAKEIKKENTEQCNAQSKEENTEASQSEETREGTSGVNTAITGETLSENAKRIATNEDSPLKNNNKSFDYSYVVEEKNKEMKVDFNSWEIVLNDEESQSDREGGKSPNIELTEENRVESEENMQSPITSKMNNEEVKEEKFFGLCGIPNEEIIGNEQERADITHVEGEEQEAKDEDGEDFLAKIEEKDGAYVEGFTSNIMREEKKDMEKVTTDIFQEIDVDKKYHTWVTSNASGPEVTALNLAESDIKKKGAEETESVGRCKAERKEYKSKPREEKIEGETPDTERCSKEYPGGVRQGAEAAIPLGERATSPTYSEIIGRIIYTDSFPSESLEWFEEESGKRGREAVEGTMKSIVGSEGRPGVTTGMAVGDESWEEPEISRVGEPFRETGDSGGPETHDKEATIIGGKEDGERKKEGEEEEEVEEEEGRSPWITGLLSNADDDDDDGMFGFHRKCTELGSSLRMGVGVVVAGGIISRDASRRGENPEGRDGTSRRSKWRGSRSGSIEEGLPIPNEDPAGRQWEEIFMGIDAMEDRSISEVIEEVSGKRRRRRTRKERDERSGKAIRLDGRPWDRDGEDRTQGGAMEMVPIAGSPMESAASQEAVEEAAVGGEWRPPTSGRQTAKGEGKAEESGGGRCETTADVGGSGGTTQGEEKGVTEVLGAEQPLDGGRRVGMPEEPWWLNGSKRGSLGGVKIEELRVDWVGAMEEGKRGRGPAEEEGVEAREGVKGMEDKAKEGEIGEGWRQGKDGGKLFSGDKGVEATPPEELEIKAADVKNLDCLPQMPIAEFHSGLEKGIDQKVQDENVKRAEVKTRKCDGIFETSPKYVGTHKVGVTRKGQSKMNIEMEGELDRKLEEEEGDEQVEEDEVDVKKEKKNATKIRVPSYEEKGVVKDSIKAESEDTKLEDDSTVGETDKCQEDDEMEDSKSMPSLGVDVLLELENENSPSKVEGSFSYGFANRGKLSRAESSGEWEFVDTGSHFAENENTEERILDEWDEQYSSNKYASSNKGVFLGSFLGNADNVQSPATSAVGMGIGIVNDLLNSLVDIPKCEEIVSTDGTSPKREGEELCGVRITLDEWEEGRRSDYLRPETGVGVRKFDLLGDWEGDEETIGIFEVATKEHKEGNLRARHGVEIVRNREEREKEREVDISDKKDGKKSGEGSTGNESGSSNVSVEEGAGSDDSESCMERKTGEVENNTTQDEDDDDIEEILRPEREERNKGGFTFTDTDSRRAFRNLEDLLGGEISFKMTTSSAQFNLWPSEEAFGGKGTWMEHIDMDAFISTAQSQQPCPGTGLLKNMTTFSRTCTVGNQKGSSTTSEQFHFSGGGEYTKGKDNVILEEEGEEIVLEEHDFDDRSDEIERHKELRSQWETSYHSFGMESHPSVKKGDAFIIYESPGTTTYAAQVNEVGSDEDTDDISNADKNAKKALTCDEDIMEGLNMDGEWEEDVIFLDDDDITNVQMDGRRGSGEYRNFSNEVLEKEETELWGIIPHTNEDSTSGDMAFAIAVDTEEIKEKTPVLPTGRWCPRLPILSPAMSAISEEDSEEILPDKEEKTEPYGYERETDVSGESQDMKNTKNDVNLKGSALSKPTRRNDIPDNHKRSSDDNEAIGGFKAYSYPFDDNLKDAPTENFEDRDSRHTLPKLDVEIEDGFGESFAKRRSSTSSVVSESGETEPMADCGAAFVVSSEIAVTLALGVAITQIIPPVTDLPETAPLPQVEKATDALSVGKFGEGQRCEYGKPEEMGYKNSDIHSTTTFDKNGKCQILRKTIDTQTEPVLVLEEIKELLDSCATVKEDILGMETVANEKRNPEEKELQSEREAQMMTFEALKPTELENNGVRPFLLKENIALEPKSAALKMQGEHFEGKKTDDNDSPKRKRDLTEASNIGKGYENCASNTEKRENSVNNNTGARKRTPGTATQAVEKGKVTESENFWEATVFERELTDDDDENEVKGVNSDLGDKKKTGRRGRGKIIFREQECARFDDEGGEIECWSNGRLIARSVTERKDAKRKMSGEGKETAFEEKLKVAENEKRVPHVEGTGEENNRRGEGTMKSSPPGGVKKKESLEEKTKESPPRTIPLEKLLGWPSENGNGGGSGGSGTLIRRESLFDDYNFSAWDNEFQLNSNPDTQKIKSQDSTGLEYYLDVDQLLNVPLAATEPEVKYVSAKEIMDTFTRGEVLDSPERKMEDKEVESKGERILEPDSINEGAAGGISPELSDEELKNKAKDDCNERRCVALCLDHESDPSEDDLFAEFLRGGILPVPQTEHETLSKSSLGQKDNISCTPFCEDRKDNTLINVTGVSLTKENTNEGGAVECLTVNQNTAVKETVLVTGLEVEATIKLNENRHEKQDLSNEENDAKMGTERESNKRGTKLRQMIDIFEHPTSTKIEREISPANEEKDEKYSCDELGKTIPIENNDRLTSVSPVSDVGTNQQIVIGREVRPLIETEKVRDVIKAGSSPIFGSFVTDGGEDTEDIEKACKNPNIGGTFLKERTADKVTNEYEILEDKTLCKGLKELKLATNDDKDNALLSPYEVAVVGQEVVKDLKLVKKPDLSSENGADQKEKTIELATEAETDKLFAAIPQSTESRAKYTEMRSKSKETKSLSRGDNSEVNNDSTKLSVGQLPMASSFEECRTVVSEAYQFLETLGDTVDEDEDKLEGEGVKEEEGKAEDSICGPQSQVEDFHPCEDLPVGVMEAVPRAVGGVALIEWLEEQSSPSSPEMFKTTASSSSSSPYSSLPTFADVSSGILSSASSKDENFTKVEDGVPRQGGAHKSELRSAQVTDTDKAADGGSVRLEDYLEEEMDSVALAKMSVASRKEYWDRRLQRAKEKSMEVVTMGPKKLPPLRVSGIVARGRMSFETSTSRDDYTTSDSGGDGGKSSSESSPSSRGKSFSQRPKAVYPRGKNSASSSKSELKLKEEEKKVLGEEREISKTSEEYSVGTTGKGSDDVVAREVPGVTDDRIRPDQPWILFDDKEDLSQKPVSKRKEIWDQKLQKMSEDDSISSATEYRRSERKGSHCYVSTKKNIRNSSTEDETDKKASSIGMKDTVPKQKTEPEGQPLPFEEKMEHEAASKKGPDVKTTGSVSRLAKLFSPPAPEPPPQKYGRGRPISKGKYTKDSGKERVKSEEKSTNECSSKAECATLMTSQGKTGMNHSRSGSCLLEEDEKNTEKIQIEANVKGKVEHQSRMHSAAANKMTPIQDTANSGSVSTNKIAQDESKGNLASRRKKYLDSVKQSIEGECHRNETPIKKSESQDSMKERMRRKEVTDVRNMWEKRSSLDGSESTSESNMNSGKTASQSAITNTVKKRYAQNEKPTSKGRMTSADKTNAKQSQDEVIKKTEERKQVNPLLESQYQQEASFTAAASYATHEMERREGDSLPLADLGSSRSCGHREQIPENKVDISKKTIQSAKKGSRQPVHSDKECEKRKVPTSADKAKIKNKAAYKGLQIETKAPLEERSAEDESDPKGGEKFTTREKRTRAAEITSPAENRSPAWREDTSPEERKESSESSEHSAVDGRKPSSGVNPTKKIDVLKKREKWGSSEDNAIEYTNSRGKRDSMEIRVTDDEDICVMREVTSVPRFQPKETMVMHDEEEELECEEELEADDEESIKSPPTSTSGVKRKPTSPRTLPTQAPGLAPAGRRMFESGKSTAEDMPILSEKDEEEATKVQDLKDVPMTAMRRSEGSQRASTEVPVEERRWEQGRRDEGERGRRLPSSKSRLAVGSEAPPLPEEGLRHHVQESGARELYRAVPVSVTVEGEHRGTDIRVEICDLEETSPAFKGEAGGDDSRYATSRRVPKGKAPAHKQPPSSTASSPDTESEGAAETTLAGFLSTPASQIRRHSAVDVATVRSFQAEVSEGRPRMRRGSGDLSAASSPRPKEDASKKRFSRARQFFETLAVSKDSTPSPPQSGMEEGGQERGKKKKKKTKGEEEAAWGDSMGRRAGMSKHRPQVVRGPKDSSESTTESEREKRHRRKGRRGTSEKTHSAPGSDVESSSSAPRDYPSLHRRRRERDFVLRSQKFGGSEREVKVSERFNVMDLFRDVAGPGVSSGRATPLGIPHQAAVLAALRSVEDVRSSATTSPYDMYRPVEADNDCEPTAAEGETAASANDENANVEEEGNVTFSSPMTLCVKKEYQAEYPHLPMTSPRRSRPRSSNSDLIPRNVLLQLDTNQNSSPKPTSRRSIAELF
ncbi:titin homolog [Hetaerina americana]|uniref:titin homolog n=1 Tax=Hetaerina americana TaxID=62018 RepID=UPI003A7F604C